MGLDMFLNKVKRIKNMTLNQIMATANYIDYLDNKDASKYTYKEWCGGDEDYVVKPMIDEVKKIIHEETIGKSYTYKTVSYELAYWRKANQIHQWFVDNVQNGVDDCGYYEVTKEQLTELLEIVDKVLDSCELIDSKVNAGYTFENGEKKIIWEDGKTIKDSSIAEELLPTQSGFFFGGTDYDQWYYEDLKSTKEQLERVLNETDFEHEIVYYSSSW